MPQHKGIKSQINSGFCYFGFFLIRKVQFYWPQTRCLVNGQKECYSWGTYCSIDRMHFLKCLKCNGLFQGFPGGKAITIWPLLSRLFSKSSYLRAPGADSWKNSILHPSQHDPSFRILLAYNGATSAPLTPHQPGGEVLHRGKTCSFSFCMALVLGEREKGKAKEQSWEKSESGQGNLLCQLK